MAHTTTTTSGAAANALPQTSSFFTHRINPSLASLYSVSSTLYRATTWRSMGRRESDEFFYLDPTHCYTSSDSASSFTIASSTVLKESHPNPYANGIWRYWQTSFWYYSDGMKIEKRFSPRDDMTNKVYVTEQDGRRFRKKAFRMNDGSTKVCGWREHPGKTKKMLDAVAPTQEGLEGLIADHHSPGVWLDTDVPKTIEHNVTASLEFRMTEVSARRQGMPVVNQTYMLFLRLCESVSGRADRNSYYPLRVSLTDFSTKGAVAPLFESETAELIREQRGELKREIAEAVFHPMRVSRMVETYGDDWDEKV